MSPLRRLSLEIFNRLGAAGLCRWLQRQECVILAYHGVVAPGEEAQADLERKFVLENDFKAQLRFIRRHYTPITLPQFLASLEGAPLPPRSILLTFDDGYAHTMNRIAPHMVELGIPGVIFVVTGLMGTDETPWPNQVELWWREHEKHFGAGRPMPPDMPADLPAIKQRLKAMAEPERAETLRRWMGTDAMRLLPGHPFRMLSWDEARALEKIGIAVESHTVTHAILARCAPERVRWELDESRETLERELGRPVTTLAYPNGGRGFFTRHDESLLAELGYRAAFSMILGRHRRGDPRMQIRRVPVGRDEGALPLFAARMVFPYSLKPWLTGRRDEVRPGYP